LKPSTKTPAGKGGLRSASDRGVEARKGKSFSSEINLAGVLRRLRAAFGGWFGRHYGDAPRAAGDLRQLCLEALERQGEVSGMVLVAQLADAYQQMDGPEQAAFFRMLATDFAVDPVAVEAAARGYLEAEGARIPAITELKAALESPRLKLFWQFNTISGGIKFLIDLRADLMARLPDDADLIGVEYDLKNLLGSWFNIGFLRLEVITWETPAEVLEKLIRYEAVHQITSWEDLKHRLTPPRTAFAFFHSAMPGEPLIFVEAAVMDGLADSIQALLDPEDPPLPAAEGDTAIFYSISNAQAGLRGIPLGNFLIKQVLGKLRAEFPHLETFATLSPIPGFRRALVERELAEGRLSRFFHKGEAVALCKATGQETAAAALAETLGSTDWVKREEVAQALRPGLLRAAKFYLTEMHGSGGAAACPVAHFHASNGALLGRINWLADTSPKGVRQSLGMMVNYVYTPTLFEEAQAAYVSRGELTTSKEVQGL
jgi:malonyl-CoA decarboxylase